MIEFALTLIRFFVIFYGTWPLYVGLGIFMWDLVGLVDVCKTWGLQVGLGTSGGTWDLVILGGTCVGLGDFMWDLGTISGTWDFRWDLGLGDFRWDLCGTWSL